MADTSLNENRLGLLIWQISNLWQSKLRQCLKNYKISLNEYLILEAIYKLEFKNVSISQKNIAVNSSIDTSVVSIKLNILEGKKLIYKVKPKNNRTSNISLTNEGKKLIIKSMNIIYKEEKKIFEKLNDETLNFKNSLRLILGKKIRIKANNYA
ncbi:MAG: hypothetical protein CMI96_02020 [Pelagibacteraceae bacterium]|nr:hypothetical protein [Pelagibacteraceae bacterium]|tara:strand:- start:29451 stop:29912 length:462 start_codon:yes stop_codon:yes gene_type:complete